LLTSRKIKKPVKKIKCRKNRYRLSVQNRINGRIFTLSNPSSIEVFIFAMDLRSKLSLFLATPVDIRPTRLFYLPKAAPLIFKRPAERKRLHTLTDTDGALV